MKIYNNNPRYGDAGPFEAESFEALADEMRDLFIEWSEAEAVQSDDENQHSIFERMRIEFIEGLTEINVELKEIDTVTKYTIDDFERFEAGIHGANCTCRVLDHPDLQEWEELGEIDGEAVAVYWIFDGEPKDDDFTADRIDRIEEWN